MHRPGRWSTYRAGCTLVTVGPVTYSMASAGEAPDDGGLVSAPVHVTDLTVDVLSSPGADGPGAADDRPAAATLVSVPVQVSGVDVDVLDAQGSGRPDQPADRH